MPGDVLPPAAAAPDPAAVPASGTPLRPGERLSSDPDPEPETSPSGAPPAGLGDPAEPPDPPLD